MPYQSWYECANGCPERLELFSFHQKCPHCGAPLLIKHDLKALAQRSPAAWMKLFDDRFMGTEWPYGSGVWGKKEWVCPALRDENIVSIFEGGTNLFWAERYGKKIGLDDLWIKQSGISHTGALHDLGMTVLASVLRQSMSVAGRAMPIVCAATPTRAASLAAYCSAAAIQAVLLIPKEETMAGASGQAQASGAVMLLVEGDYLSCIDLASALNGSGELIWVKPFEEILLEGLKTVAVEMVQQFDWEAPEVIIVPAADPSFLIGVGAGLEMMLELGLINRRPRLVAAVESSAHPFLAAGQESNQAESKKFGAIPATGVLEYYLQFNRLRAAETLRRFSGLVELIEDKEGILESASADLNGLFTCPETGLALAALRKLIEAGSVSRRDRVIVLAPENGLKFLLEKQAYHMGMIIGAADKFSNRPQIVEPRAEAVLEAALRKLKQYEKRN
jgi:threonine synthase